jgi:hypothetical protein
MEIGKVIRPLTFGLAVALSGFPSSAQAATASIVSASQEAGPASVVSASPAQAEMAPPKTPKVTCIGDQLTISADNSTLGGVLAAVHNCTGVKVDIPEGAASSRVFEELGPGPARQVLEALLSGTELDYVIGSSSADPQKIETVVLMVRSTDAQGSTADDHTLTPQRRAWLQTRQNHRPGVPTSEESSPAADESQAAPAAENAVTAPADNGNANGTQTPPADTPPPAADVPVPPVNSVATPMTTNEPSAGVNPALTDDKSTSERISDMQQMFEQRRLMNQNQNPSQNPNPAPTQQ